RLRLSLIVFVDHCGGAFKPDETAHIELDRFAGNRLPASFKEVAQIPQRLLLEREIVIQILPVRFLRFSLCYSELRFEIWLRRAFTDLSEYLRESHSVISFRDVYSTSSCCDSSKIDVNDERLLSCRSRLGCGLRSRF